uniref:Transmembrane protein n=1 Tax=Globisporangium ultimum (strain ATCC 200006 / CBS 805.95 / DAOM BR144) TaxID=431595 RepID=K3W8J4_GLOUD
MAASRSSVHASFSPATGTFTKLKLHHSKKGLTAMKVVHLLHRTGILVAAIVYFVFCVKATKLTIEILRGKDNPVMSPPPSDVSLLRTALGTSATTVRDTPLHRTVVHDDGTPAGGTLYLEKSGASFKACARMSPLATEIVADGFQRSIYDAIVLGAGYNLTFLAPDSIELIVPIVDCSSIAVVEEYVSSTRMTYLVRDRRTSADVSILTVDLYNQEYFIKAQKEHGPAGVAIVSLVKDLQPTTAVDYHFLVALEYPYEEPEFDVYTFLQVDDEGMWSLQHIPKDPKKELPFVLTTAFRTGFFLKSETRQSTVSNEVPILAQTPLDAITRADSASKTVQYDSWAWVHLVQLLFGLNLLLNLLILLTVVFHNLRAGKFWIGDAFVPISSTTTIRGAIVLVTWGVSGFWSFYELAYHDTYEILGISTTHAYDDIVRADLMCLYLMICGLMGTVFRERVDPLLTMICFEIGFESRRRISQWFP